MAQAAAQAQLIPTRQPSLSDQWVFSGSLFGGLPVGEFKKHEDGGGGGELMVGFQPWRRQPFVLRGSFAGMKYGGVKARAYQDVCDAFTCWTEEITYDARNHSMWILQGGPEFMATDGTWRPFGFAHAGVTFFSSRATLIANGPTGPDPESQSIFSSNNLSTAYGAGIRRVTTKHGREGGFELAFRVTRNAKASYLTEEGIRQNPDGTWAVSPRHGAANVLGIHLGFWIGPHILWNERR
ncbi:MAG: hypothetical protein WD825_10950 [Gemmatimonadaceae bacterium]